MITTSSLASAKKLPSGRKGRPRGGDDLALHNHLLLVAREVFFDVGLGSATIDLIAQEAGMSKPTLYRRYKDKVELFEAVMQASVNAWSEGGANNPIAEHNTLAEGLRHYIRIQMRANLSPEYADLTRLIYAERKRFPNLGKQLLEKVANSRIERIVQLIRKYEQIDGIPCREPETVAEAMRGMVSGWMQVINMGDEKFDADDQARFLDRVVELLMGSRASW